MTIRSSAQIGATVAVPAKSVNDTDPIAPRASTRTDLIELLFFAYRDFVARPDAVLAGLKLGRAHHRVLHFVHRSPGLPVSDLLRILRITKQSLGRVLNELIDAGYVEQKEGPRDRRQRLLYATPAGRALAQRLVRLQSEHIAAALEEAGGDEAIGRFLFAMISAQDRAEVAGRIGAFREGAKGADLHRTGPATAVGERAPHLLVIDDDTRIRTLLSRYLAERGFRVTTAADSAEARERLGALAFDLLIVDIMMPGEDGIALTRALREHDEVPILLLTARSGTESRIDGLEAGADDYLPKPFDPRELVLRVNNILKRRILPTPQASGEVKLGHDMVFNRDRGELRRGIELVRLTEREREMLAILAAKPGETVTRFELVGEGEQVSERAVDVQINRLRRKLEADPANPLVLQTVRGTGYRLMAS